jgi:hypothetical protein
VLDAPGRPGIAVQIRPPTLAGLVFGSQRSLWAVRGRRSSSRTLRASSFHYSTRWKVFRGRVAATERDLTIQAGPRA